MTLMWSYNTKWSYEWPNRMLIGKTKVSSPKSVIDNDLRNFAKSGFESSFWIFENRFFSPSAKIFINKNFLDLLLKLAFFQRNQTCGIVLFKHDNFFPKPSAKLPTYLPTNLPHINIIILIHSKDCFSYRKWRNFIMFIINS